MISATLIDGADRGMLVVFGANGRTGIALLKEAQAREVPVRPVVRDDQDTQNLDYLVPVEDVFYADPVAPDSLPHCLEGATWVISAIDPRTAGPGAPIYPGEAAGNIVAAAARAGAERVLHLSVMGAYRWSFAPLNRKSFHLENAVKACNAPWGLLRFSCYHDEVIEGHVRPPDGGRPWPFVSAARYAPCSRRDAARMALDYMERYVPGRAQPSGGPVVYTGDELSGLVAPHRAGGTGKTRYMKLPTGDISVALTTTRGAVGYVPGDRLEPVLEGREGDDDAEPEPPAPLERTVYPSGDPARHPADRGETPPVMAAWGEDLRRVVHTQLSADLARLGLPTEGVRLDFSQASAGDRRDQAHQGTFTTLTGARALAADGAVLHTGDVDFLRDKLAEEFHCWWSGPGGIPDGVWDRLDLGARRRLAKSRHHKGDPRFSG